MPTFNEKRFRNICDEITETCACKKPDGYCFYRMLITHQRPSLRMLIQVECIERFKYEESERQGKDIGNDEAAKLWCENGLAGVFGQIYGDDGEDLSVKEIYKRTMSEWKKKMAKK
jgi:hypothetical protein